MPHSRERFCQLTGVDFSTLAPIVSAMPKAIPERRKL
uniref:Uncharacterized protein n=1 Tax=Arundo donax TaxID=35708 RepID=A0A0A9C6R7_ARUDO